MKWPNTGFTVELACGARVYMGTLEEMAQREAAGIYGPDPCAEDMSAGADLTETSGVIAESSPGSPRVQLNESELVPIA